MSERHRRRQNPSPVQKSRHPVANPVGTCTHRDSLAAFRSRLRSQYGATFFSSSACVPGPARHVRDKSPNKSLSNLTSVVLCTNGFAMVASGVFVMSQDDALGGLSGAEFFAGMLRPGRVSRVFCAFLPERGIAIIRICVFTIGTDSIALVRFHKIRV